MGEEQDADIFRAHRRLLLADPAASVEKVEAAIANRHVDAATALQLVLEEYIVRSSRRSATITCVSGPPTFAMRHRTDPGTDYRRRLALCASRERRSDDRRPGGSSVANQIALTGYSGRRHCHGAAVDGPEHAAILARSLGIPAAAGFRGLMREGSHGRHAGARCLRRVAVCQSGNGNRGAIYRERQHDCADLRKQLIAGPISTGGHAGWN